MFAFEEDFKQGEHMATSSIDGPPHSDKKTICFRNNFGDFLSEDFIYIYELLLYP